jgi:AcrR family transcriptional regulator
VARSRPPDRFERLRQAALRVFARKGLRRARMSDVAREAGLSAGALYTYFASKQALFHWLVEHGAEPGPIAAPVRLPLPSPAPGAIEKRLRESIARALRLPVLDAALARRRVADPRAELAEVVDELYQCIEASRMPAIVIERSALELPELFAIYFLETRRGLLERLARYVERRARAGHFRAVAQPAVAARWIVEAVTWFARHRHGDADPSGLPDGEALRAQVVALITCALVPDRSRPEEKPCPPF